MSYKTDRTKRVFKNGCYYDSETSTKVLAIAPYGQVNKAQCTKPVREPLYVKGY